MGDAAAPPLIEHLERHLGPIEQGWRQDADGNVMPVQVAKFVNPGHVMPVSYATLGLSNHILRQPSGADVRQELLCCGPSDPELNPAGLLAVLAGDLIDSHEALVRGQVLGPAGPLLPGSALEALYCAAPVYFSDDFATFGGMDPVVVIVWCMPISAGEAAFVRGRGWDAFEDLLVEEDPDLRDWRRPALV